MTWGSFKYVPMPVQLSPQNPRTCSIDIEEPKYTQSNRQDISLQRILLRRVRATPSLTLPAELLGNPRDDYTHTHTHPPNHHLNAAAPSLGFVFFFAGGRGDGLNINSCRQAENTHTHTSRAHEYAS